MYSLLCTVDTSHHSVLWGNHSCCYLCLFALSAFSTKLTPWFSKAKVSLAFPITPSQFWIRSLLSYLITTCTHSFHNTEHFFFFCIFDGREACCAAIHGVAKSRTRLSDWTELRALGILLIIATLASNRTQYTKIRLRICRIKKHLLTKHFPELHLLRSTRVSQCRHGGLATAIRPPTHFWVIENDSNLHSVRQV